MDLKSLKFPLVALGCITLLATQPGASCVDTTTTTDGKTTSQHKVDPNWNDSDSSNNDGHDDNDPNYIPRRADIVMEGKGLLEYTVDADGQLWVQDLKSETTILTRRAHRGERISVAPDDNRIKLDDDTISKTDLKSDHTHRIYLLRDGRFADRDHDWNQNGDNHNANHNDDHWTYDRSHVQINDRDVGPYNEHGVPSKARMMDQGMNREMTFVSDQPGRVFIFDVEHDVVAATVDINGRQVFTFSPGADKVSIDGKRVVSCDFDPKSQYRIYFYH